MQTVPSYAQTTRQHLEDKTTIKLYRESQSLPISSSETLLNIFQDNLLTIDFS
jgi:hypothetical protein